MSAKDILLEVADKLPPDATLVDAICELEFRQGRWRKGWLNWIGAKVCRLKR